MFDFQTSLTGDHLALRPVVADDLPDLLEIGADPEIWAQHPRRDRGTEAGFRAYFADGLASGGALVALDRSTGKIAGWSRYSVAFAAPGEIEIGWTFLGRAYWGRGDWGGTWNAEMKQLMLGHAFSHFDRVIFRIDANNIRSRRAAEKIGATLTDRTQPTEFAGVASTNLFYSIARVDFLGRSHAEAQTMRLLGIMAALRHQQTGCPWDLQQDFDSIAPYTIEEAYEVADAIARRDHAALPDELGDLLLQVVYHARLGEEAGLFSYADVARLIADKMVRRHPHVFAQTATAQTATGAPPLAGFWENAKEHERLARHETGTLAGVPINLPALTRATKLSARAARVGFDWPDAAGSIDKLEEETRELRAELGPADPARLADELGDVLFTAANVARKLGLDPEACLRQANEKFHRRFDAMEQIAERRGVSLPELSLDAMERAWQQVKQAERQA